MDPTNNNRNVYHQLNFLNGDSVLSNNGSGLFFAAENFGSATTFSHIFVPQRAQAVGPQAASYLAQPPLNLQHQRFDSNMVIAN